MQKHLKFQIQHTLHLSSNQSEIAVSPQLPRRPRQQGSFIFRVPPGGAPWWAICDVEEVISLDSMEVRKKRQTVSPPVASHISRGTKGGAG